MPLPPNFQPAEHLQDLCKRYFNRQVREFFSDLGGDEWVPDISTTRASLRVGCTHLDSDTVAMTQLRLALFEYVRTLKFSVPMMGIPVSSFQEERRYQPQIILNFQEDFADVEPGYEVVTGRVSFRLMNHTSDTITPPIAQTYAQRIQTNFVAGGGFVWRKGKNMYSYSDWSKGYQLQILARTQSDALNLIDRVLDIQNDTVDLSKLNVSENQAPAAAYPTIPGNDFIYGASRKRSRKRPVADVRFQYASLNLHGLKNQLPLVDRSGLYPSALIA